MSKTDWALEEARKIWPGHQKIEPSKNFVMTTSVSIYIPIEEQIAAALRSAVDREREGCAKVAELHPSVCMEGRNPKSVKSKIAAAIRARGNE